MNNLGSLHCEQGNFCAAEALLLGTRQIARRVLGQDHPLTLEAVAHLANLSLCQRDSERAELLFTEALRGQSRVLGTQHPDALSTASKLAKLLGCDGREA
jgi:hypothetical protein